MKLLRTVTFLTLALASRESDACTWPIYSAEVVAKDATIILVGYVTGEMYPDFESSILAGAPATQSPVNSARYVRVAFTEAIRGEKSAPVELRVPCDNSFPALFDRIVVVDIAGLGLQLYRGSESDIRRAVQR